MEDNKPQPASANPYAASTVAQTGNNNFIPGGRAVPIGQGMAWIGHGWALFTQSPLMWIVSMVLAFVIFLALNFVPLIGTLAANVMIGLLAGGLMLGAHAQHGGREFAVSDLFSGFNAPHMKPLLIVGAIYAASLFVLTVLAAGMIIAILGASGAAGAIMSGDTGAILGLIAGATIGSMLVLLIVMAIAVPIFMAYWFAPALVALQGVAPIDALKASFSACLKNFMPFLVYGLVFLVLFVVGSLPLGLGLLVVVPLMYTSTYAAYRDVFLGDGGA